ncbi:hypothetical protein CRYPA_391 [uncultured Candidatus Thioglobus sp.]|nr:hypothetical protein CRYPA_391 [uncultured Candidatus Thioglobus sp.]
MIDKQKFQEIKEIMGDGFDDFIKLFLQELQADIDILQHTADFDIIHLKAHSQKSSCLLMGAIELADIFLHIEQLAKDKKNVVKLIDKLPVLLKKISQIL